MCTLEPFYIEDFIHSPVVQTGFLTPQELFYVRNHGPVPQVRDEDIPNWEICIEGSVHHFLVCSSLGR